MPKSWRPFQRQMRQERQTTLTWGWIENWLITPSWYSGQTKKHQLLRHLPSSVGMSPVIWGDLHLCHQTVKLCKGQYFPGTLPYLCPASSTNITSQCHCQHWFGVFFPVSHVGQSSNWWILTNVTFTKLMAVDNGNELCNLLLTQGYEIDMQILKNIYQHVKTSSTLSK